MGLTRNAPRLVALPPRTSTHPKTNMIAIQRATLCLCLLSSLLAGGMGKRTLFQGIDPVSDIEQGLQGVGQDLLNMFDGLEQEPDATVSGLTVAVGSEPSGQMVFKPE